MILLEFSFNQYSIFSSVQFISFAQLCLTLCNPTDCSIPGFCPSPIPRVYPNSCPLSRWCHPTISSSVVPSFSHLQSFPVSESFQVSQFFASGGQSIGVSVSPSVLLLNIQDWFPLGWTGWISLQSKGLSRAFSNTTVQMRGCVLNRFSHAQLFANPWTIACQALLSMRFSRQEYWSGLPCPSPGYLPTQGSKPHLLHLLHCQVDSWEAFGPTS